MRTRSRKFALAALLLAPALLLWLRCEGTPPHARLQGSPALRSTAPQTPGPLRITRAGRRVVFEAGDAGSGLRRARLRLVHVDGEGILFERHYPGGLLLGGEAALTRRIETSIDPQALGIAAGGAMLMLDLWDWSWASWPDGNHSVLETPLRIAPEAASGRAVQTPGKVRRSGGAQASGAARSGAARVDGGAVRGSGGGAQVQGGAVRGSGGGAQMQGGAVRGSGGGAQADGGAAGRPGAAP